MRLCADDAYLSIRAAIDLTDKDIKEMKVCSRQFKKRKCLQGSVCTYVYLFE